MEFAEALRRFGFLEREERSFGSSGTRLYAASPSRYMTYTVHAFPDGSAIFSWEFAIADYLATKGIQIGSDEALNQFMYPRSEIRGQQDATWLASAIEQTETLLSVVRLDRPES